MSSMTNRSSFQFTGYLIEESHVKIVNPNVTNDMVLQIDPDIIKGQEDNSYNIVLNVENKDKAENFNIKFKVNGTFLFEGSQEELLKYVGVNAPSIMFPYIRAYLSNITALSGLKPVILPTFNLTNVGKVLQKKLQDLVKANE